MLWLWLSLSAQADTFTLDNGATVEGLLAEYTLQGSCQISVTDGPFQGAIMTIPCTRITSFERGDQQLPTIAPLDVSEPLATKPVASPILEEETFSPTPEPMALQQPKDAPHATSPVNPPAPADVVAAPAPSPPPPAPTPAAAPASSEEGLWSEATSSEEEPLAADVTDPGVLPSLPNLRMMRRPSSAPADDTP